LISVPHRKAKLDLRNPTAANLLPLILSKIDHNIEHRQSREPWKERGFYTNYTQDQSTNPRTIRRIATKKMSGFKPVELFGGAITAEFPATFGDVRYVSPNPRYMVAKGRIGSMMRKLDRALEKESNSGTTAETIFFRRWFTDFFFESNIRQVPDNQEVYLDGEGFTSVVVEILEREEKPDNEALEYHLRDLVEDEEDDAAEKTKVWWRGEAVGGKLP
jgi:hypothetical protein